MHYHQGSLEGHALACCHDKGCTVSGGGKNVVMQDYYCMFMITRPAQFCSVETNCTVVNCEFFMSS